MKRFLSHITLAVLLGIAAMEMHGQTFPLIQQEIRLFNFANSQYISLTPPSGLSTTYNLILPGSQGAAGSILTNNGSGTLSFTTILPVANGGTGAATLTGVVIGNGTSALTAATLSSGISDAITDETGSGSLVFATAPTVTTLTVSSGGASVTGNTLINTTGNGNTTIGNATTTGTTTIATNSTTGPLVITGLPTGVVDDVLLISGTNQVSRITQASLFAGQGWSLTGNDISASSGALNVAPVGSWMGTRSTSAAKDLRIATNGLTRMIVTSAGAISMGSTLDVTGLITGTAGATLSGGTTSINNNSNNTTNINTGTSTGAVNIGNALTTNAIAGMTTITGGTSINTTGTSSTTIGNASSTTSVTGTVNVNTSGNGNTTIGNAATTGTTTIATNSSTGQLRITGLETPTTSSSDVMIVNSTSGRVEKITQADLLAGTGWALTGNNITSSTGAINAAVGGSWIGTRSTSTVRDFRIATNGLTRMIVASDGAISMGGATTINDGINSATSINTGTSTGAVTIGGSAAQTIDIGTGAANKTVSLGSSSGTSTTTISGGSGGLNLNVGNGQPTNINTGAAASALAIGGASTTTTVLGALNTDGNTTINDNGSTFTTGIGTGTTTGAVTIGGSAAQTIDIGTGAAAKTVLLGSTNGSSVTTISGGSAVNINTIGSGSTNIATGSTSGTVTIGGAGAQTIAIGTGAAAKTVSLGSSNTTSTTTLLSGSGGLNLNVSNNQPTNINTGNSTGAVAIGTSATSITVLGPTSINTSGTTAGTTIGNTSAATAVTIASGSAGRLTLNGLPTQTTTSDDVLLINSSQQVSRITKGDLFNSTGWQLTGNSVTDSTTSYIGTTDEAVDRPLVIRTGGTERARFAGGSGYAGFGTSSPNVQVDINGAIATRPGTATANSSTTNVTVGNSSFIVITSDETFGLRRVTLSNGLQDGQRLTILVLGAGGDVSFGVRLLTSDANLSLSGDAGLEHNDTMELIWYNGVWRELRRSANDQ